MSFPVGTNIGYNVFQRCYNLKSLYLTSSNLCTLTHSNAFSSTPIGGYSASAGTYGSVYVPASLLTQYQTATNWTYFSSRFVAFDETNIITFTISGVEYQAEEGMTWAEWCDSEYNTDGWYNCERNGDEFIIDSSGRYYVILHGLGVKPEDVITSENYRFEPAPLESEPEPEPPVEI